MGQYGLWGTKLAKEKPRFWRGLSLSSGPGGLKVVEDSVGLVGHLVGQVDVGVRGELVVRMAEDLLDDDQTAAGFDQPARAGVPEIVELDPSELQGVLDNSE